MAVFQFIIHRFYFILSFEPVAQPERERDFAEVEAAGSSPAGFTQTLQADVAQR